MYETHDVFTRPFLMTQDQMLRSFPRRSIQILTYR